MVTTTIRVSAKTHSLIHELADIAGVPMQQIVEEAVEAYRRQQILLATNAAYAKLQTDAEAWSELENERAEWDATLEDGLERV